MAEAQAAFDEGLAAHQAGRLETARAFYERALAAEPDHFDALHLLGLIHAQGGRLAEGAKLMQRAAQLNADVAAVHSNLGWALTELGRLDEALAACQRAISLAPAASQVHANLGNLLLRQQRFGEAIASYDRALGLQPADPTGWYNRANALRDKGALAEALASYDRALGLQPAFAEAWNNRGAVLERLRRSEEAARSFERAVAARPDLATAHANLAKVLNDLKRSDEALAAADRAIALAPGSAAAHNHRSLALFDLRRLGEALAAADHAVGLDGAYAEAHNSRAIALFDLRRLDAALAACDAAIALQPDFAAAHLNRATSLLSLGDLKRGFESYRWRWRVNGFHPAVAALRPEWRGGDLDGKRVLVYGEQGFGDHLQFVRYLPRVAAKAAHATLMTEPALARLFRRSLPGVDVVAEAAPPTDYDLQTAIMDLPHAFETTLESVPAPIPYLAIDPIAAARWKQRLAHLPGLKVGLVWAGDTHAGRPAGAAVDRRRSLRLAQLAPLAATPRVTFISLQKGPPAAQASDPPPGLRLVNHTDDLTDFADTADLIAALDLVIAVDTAVAHLAGALGKPVWILSRYEGDWRWLNGREDSPWYPTARLFHQRSAGAWDEVVARVAAALREAAAG
ncbi:MAG TPA: tetratricopeptide repeat protein [Caulobacteraceae bacterium]|nr:tetratricopeptide repeat protein [Caulobacteraceae bacterium]